MRERPRAMVRESARVVSAVDVVVWVWLEVVEYEGSSIGSGEQEVGKEEELWRTRCCQRRVVVMVVQPRVDTRADTRNGIRGDMPLGGRSQRPKGRRRGPCFAQRCPSRDDVLASRMSRPWG